MELAQHSAGHRWELYRLLAEPVRLRLLSLAAAEELAIGELADLLREGQPNVSRHVAPLRRAGLLKVRKQGTRALVRLADSVLSDPVVADALAAGDALCQEDGSLSRVAEVLAARDAATRAFFAEPKEGESAFLLPAEMGAYLSALGALLPRRRLAVDVGTGEGSLLEVLAPLYTRVVAVDRARAQLDRAEARLARRGYGHVELLTAEVSDPALFARVSELGGADAVFASRVLHHAPRPADTVRTLASLLSSGGSLVIIDYMPHDDERMRTRADVWFGFEPEELCRLARASGLVDTHVTPIPKARCGDGPDAHLDWQALTARRPDSPIPSAKEAVARHDDPAAS